MEMVHGGGRRISELYIPTAGIVLNSVDGRVCCFRENGDRYKKSDELSTNNSLPEKKGITYVPFSTVQAATEMLDASDVLKLKIDEISKLCKIKSKKSPKKGKKWAPPRRSKMIDRQ